MWWRRKATDEPCLTEGWVGHLDFHILAPGGTSMGLLIIELTDEIVEMRFGQRTLGVFEREALRSWMESPAKPLVGDSCVLSMQRHELSIALGCATPDVIPRQISRQLQSAVRGA